MELLIRSSLTTQEQARVRAEGAGQGQRALVIGGSGKMGRWFVDFLDSQGFDVTVADPAGPVAGIQARSGLAHPAGRIRGHRGGDTARASPRPFSRRWPSGATRG